MFKIFKGDEVKHTDVSPRHLWVSEGVKVSYVKRKLI